MMNTDKLSIIVLAAGGGTRMRSALPKVLHPLCGRTLLGHVLALADQLGAGETVVVLAGDTIDQVRDSFGPRWRYALQPQPLGTGHAVMQARTALEGRPGQVLALYGDTPLLQAETARHLLETHYAQHALVGLVSFYADPPTGYGRVLRDASGQVTALIEERNLAPEQRSITEANSGVMCFDADWLWRRIGDVERNPVKGEYYLTDLVAMAVADQGPGAVVAVPASDAREAWGINDRAQLAHAEAVLRERIIAELLNAGVTIMDPAATYIDIGVTVGADSVLLPGTLLRGATHIGPGCEIGPHTTIVDTTIGAQARVRHALVEDTTIEAGANVGPFVHIRGAQLR